MNQITTITENLDATVLRGMSDDYLHWCIEQHAKQVRELQAALDAGIEEARVWATLIDASDRPDELKRNWLKILGLPL